MPRCNIVQVNEAIDRARGLLARYEDMAEMIRLGAYRMGSDPLIDEAIHYYPKLEKFLAQAISERSDLATGYAELNAILADGMAPREPPEIPPDSAGDGVDAS